jgi:formamidopyrimidine-DNA glycosylase
MTLANAYLLANDLLVLKDWTLDEFYSADAYTHHNEFTLASIFPVIDIGGISMSPRLEGIGRWGRHIVLTFSTCTMVFKMGHRTSIMVTNNQYPSDLRHTDIGCMLTFTNQDSQTLFFIYADFAECGQFTVYPVGEVPAEFAYLGMDILDVGFTPQYLIAEATKLSHLKDSKCIKSFLMSPNVIAWLDNEIASEVLFLSGIHPMLSVETSLSFHSAVTLIKSFKILYTRILECVRNDYCLTSPMPIEALYSIFGRDGSECVMCGNTIQKILIEGRNTYVCPTCQVLHKKDAAHV